MRAWRSPNHSTMPPKTDKQLSQEIATSLASEDLTSLLAAARKRADHTTTDINGSAALRTVLQACEEGKLDTLRASDWELAKVRAAAFARPSGGSSGADKRPVSAARFFAKTVSARLSLNSATCKGPVWDHPYRDSALKVLESFYDTPEIAPTLDRTTVVDGVSAIGEFDLATEDESALVDFMEICKRSVSGTGH